LIPSACKVEPVDALIDKELPIFVTCDNNKAAGTQQGAQNVLSILWWRLAGLNKAGEIDLLNSHQAVYHLPLLGAAFAPAVLPSLV